MVDHWFFKHLHCVKLVGVGRNTPKQTQKLNMGMKLIYGLILLVIISIIGISLFIISKKKKSKFGIGISILLFIIVILSFMTNSIDEWTISKKDVISDLSHVNIKLQDNFKIIKNDVSGMPERIQKTTIEISPEDKNRIIEKIKTSKNYKSYSGKQDITNDNDQTEFGFSREIYNFHYPEFYSIETYTEIDNYPTKLFVSIDKKRNIIEYQRIED